jgi:hypothetical protein
MYTYGTYGRFGICPSHPRAIPVRVPIRDLFDRCTGVGGDERACRCAGGLRWGCRAGCCRRWWRHCHSPPWWCRVIRLRHPAPRRRRGRGPWRAGARRRSTRARRCPRCGASPSSARGAWGAWRGEQASVKSALREPRSQNLKFIEWCQSVRTVVELPWAAGSCPCVVDAANRVTIYCWYIRERVSALLT